MICYEFKPKTNRGSQIFIESLGIIIGHNEILICKEDIAKRLFSKFGNNFEVKKVKRERLKNISYEVNRLKPVKREAKNLKKSMRQLLEEMRADKSMAGKAKKTKKEV